jgi:hypothetical protein
MSRYTITDDFRIYDEKEHRIVMNSVTAEPIQAESYEGALFYCNALESIEAKVQSLQKKDDRFLSPGRN